MYSYNFSLRTRKTPLYYSLRVSRMRPINKTPYLSEKSQTYFVKTENICNLCLYYVFLIQYW